MKIETKARLALTLVAFLWGAGFIATEFGLDGNIKPNQLLFLRFALATVVFYLINFKKINKNLNKSLKYGIITGLFLFAGFFLQTNGQLYTTPSSTAFLTATSVIFVPIIYCIHTRTLLKRHVFLSIVGSITGIAMLTLTNGLNVNFGDTLSILCAFSFALHIYFSGRLTKKHNLEATSFTFVQFLTSTILLSVLFLLDLPSLEVFTFKSSLSIAYLAFFSTLLCFFMQIKYQKMVSETTTSLILSTESVFATIMSIFIFKETFELVQILGIVIIFFSIIYCETQFSFLKKTK